MAKAKLISRIDNYPVPTIRIQKIVLNDFKSVRHGEIVFNCGRKTVLEGTESDILGIYGQNGSGKTTVIESLVILKYVLSGNSIDNRYAECISVQAKYASLEFTFDLQYHDDPTLNKTLVYSFKIDALEKNLDAIKNHDNDLSHLYRIRVFDEVIKASGMFEDEVLTTLQEIITTTDSGYPIGNSRKRHNYVGKERNKAYVDLEVCRRIAEKESKSFLFMDDTLDVFEECVGYNDYYRVLRAMRQFAIHYLYAVDTRFSGSNALTNFPFNTRLKTFSINLLGNTTFKEFVYDDFKYLIDKINLVLPTLIVDFTIEMKADPVKYKYYTEYQVQFYSKRRDIVVPLRCESEGVLKMISILFLICAAYNDSKIVVAIDELDAGIYEYLLGEIVSGMEMYGVGQFIFTSHNLRPLEVLKKENLIFTTTNPYNRYIRLKGVGRTNNLRNLYFREILGSAQDEQMYDAAKSQKMVSAFLKAGVGFVQRSEE